MKIIRYKYNTYNVIDRVYNNDKLQFEQTNLNSKNRFGAKKFKCNNGTTLAVNSWEWGNIKEQRNEKFTNSKSSTFNGGSIKLFEFIQSSSN